jgi:D-amino-acid oxidase
LVTEKLLEKNKILFPELLNQDGEFDFISEQLGMRPHRVGGIRLEIEYVSGAQESRKVPIVHNYGHSHGG